MSSSATESTGTSMDENSKKAAAVTAVLYYLAAEKEAAFYEAAAAAGQTRQESDGFWSYSGRQSQMMLRGMAQMRLFPAWKG